jgi:hypothetical protein
MLSYWGIFISGVFKNPVPLFLQGRLIRVQSGWVFFFKIILAINFINDRLNPVRGIEL